MGGNNGHNKYDYMNICVFFCVKCNVTRTATSRHDFICWEDAYIYLYFFSYDLIAKQLKILRGTKIFPFIHYVIAFYLAFLVPICEQIEEYSCRPN